MGWRCFWFGGESCGSDVHTRALPRLVHVVSALPSDMLDDGILGKLGDLVEQLVFAFPDCVPNMYGPR